MRVTTRRTKDAAIKRVRELADLKRSEAERTEARYARRERFAEARGLETALSIFEDVTTTEATLPEGD